MGVRQFISGTSLRMQVLSLCALSTAITGVGAIVSMTWTGQQSSFNIGPYTFFHWRLTTGIVLASLLGLMLMVLAINRVIRSLSAVRAGMVRVIEGELEIHPTPTPAAADVAGLQLRQHGERLDAVVVVSDPVDDLPAVIAELLSRHMSDHVDDPIQSPPSPLATAA